MKKISILVMFSFIFLGSLTAHAEDGVKIKILGPEEVIQMNSKNFNRVEKGYVTLVKNDQSFCSGVIAKYKGIEYVWTNTHCCRELLDVTKNIDIQPEYVHKGIKYAGEFLRITEDFDTNGNDICHIRIKNKHNTGLEISERVVIDPDIGKRDSIAFMYTGFELYTKYKDMVRQFVFLYSIDDDDPNQWFTAADFRPGMSGSPIFDRRGKIIGLAKGMQGAIADSNSKSMTIYIPRLPVCTATMFDHSMWFR